MAGMAACHAESLGQCSMSALAVFSLHSQPVSTLRLRAGRGKFAALRWEASREISFAFLAKICHLYRR